MNIQFGEFMPDLAEASAEKLDVARNVVPAAVGYDPFPDLSAISTLTIDSSIVLLLHGDGADASTTITDNSSVPKTVTAVGNAQLDTAQFKFGTASILFDGTGDNLTVPDSADWVFGAKNFTIECWVRFSAIAGTQTLFSQYVDVNNLWQIRKDNATNFIVAVWIDGGTTRANYISTAAAFTAADTWYHVAVVRSGTSFQIFINGTSITLTATVAISTNTLGDTASVLSIGSNGNATNYLFGWLDDIRITKGLARYTTNFTAPTAAFENFLTDPIARGTFQVQKTDGTFDTYTCTETSIYKLAASTFALTNVSGSNYNLPDTSRWSGKQFGTRLILTNLFDGAIYIDVNTGTSFAPLLGSPPKAKFIEVMDDKVVLSNLSSDPAAIAWSDINNSDEWTLGLADQQSFPDAGEVQGFFPHARLILMQGGVRQVISTNDTLSFNFPDLAKGQGSICPYGSVEIGDKVFWVSDSMFYLGNGNGFQPVGENKFNKYFFENVRVNSLWLVEATVDPNQPRILLAYPTTTGDLFNRRILIYDYSLNKATEIIQSTYCLSHAATPGINADTFTGIYVDSFDFSVDSDLWRGGKPALSACPVVANLTISSFTGPNMAAILRTGALELAPGSYSRVQSAMPMIQGTGGEQAELTIGKRPKLSSPSVQSTAIKQQASGLFRLNHEARLHDFQLAIPAGLDWSKAKSLDNVIFTPTSER